MKYFIEFKPSGIFVRETELQMEPYLTKSGSRHWVSAASKEKALDLAEMEAEVLVSIAETEDAEA